MKRNEYHNTSINDHSITWLLKYFIKTNFTGKKHNFIKNIVTRFHFLTINKYSLVGKK